MTEPVETIEIEVPTEDMPLDPIAALNAENQILASEIEALKDKNLRLLADMDNLRRRTQREIADGRVYGITNFARDLLSVSDNLGRALEAVDSTHDTQSAVHRRVRRADVDFHVARAQVSFEFVFGRRGIVGFRRGSHGCCL